MNNYYLLGMDSLIQSFSVIDSGEIITFKYTSQETQTPFEKFQKGDKLLGYYYFPINRVKILFEIVSVDSEDQIEITKSLEVDPGIELSRSIVERLEQQNLVQLGYTEFQNIYVEMLETLKLEQEDEYAYLYSLDNKAFAMETINILQKHGAFTEEIIRFLTDKESSSKILKNSFPILKKIDLGEAALEKGLQLKDISGRSRYYPEEINAGNDVYVITNNWYYKGENGRDTRTPFVEWIKRVIGLDVQHNIENIEIISLEDIKVTAEFVNVPYNYLIFGAPGTGKSHEITKLQEEHFADNDCWERVTFYSTYSYPNFVGCYKPKMNGSDIVYEFVAGPFIRILEKAYKHPDKNFLLIIEEINRANPAAVFGDIFQLLDRDNGKSEYYINASEELKLYFAQKFVKDFGKISDELEKEKILNAFGKIYLPSNVYIWATMNSADQGVYPMDTAFKRRWEFRYIGINENQEKMKDVCFYVPHKEKGTVKVNWNKLRCTINDILSGPQCRVNEDKLLGPYFISGELLKNNEVDKCVLDNEKFIKTFKNKVLMYLFEDAAKQRQTEIFKGCSDSRRFSSICDQFDKEGLEIFGSGFTEKLIEK